MKRKKVFRILIILLILLLIIAVVGKRKGWFGKGIEYKVSIEKPEVRDITELITANGKIQPVKEVKISSDVSGQIVELHVIEGQEVKQGDLLLKIDPDIYLSNLDRMEASLNTAKANLANSKARFAQIKAQFKSTELSFERSSKLWDQKAISQADYESALAAFEMGKADVTAAQESVNSAEFTVSSAEASLKEARENLAKTTIYAPVSGTVSMLNVEEGERVVGTIQMAGTEMLRIADLNKMEVLVDVNENDIVRVSLDDTAIVEVDAYLGEKFRGVVGEIANSANSVGITTDQVTSFNVKIRILKESYEHLIPEGEPNFYPFRPGMSATVDIMTNTENNVISVPIEAVTTRNAKDTAEFIARFDNRTEFQTDENSDEKKTKEEENILEVVFVNVNNTSRIKEVKTGIQDNNYIQILTGLSIEDEVIVAPYSAISKKLSNGQKINIVKKEELFGGRE